MVFIGRKKEIEMLNTLYSKGGKSVLLYGRRRIGKTTLLEKFSDGKNTLFLRCLKDSESQNFSYFSNVLSIYSKKEIIVSTYIELISCFEKIIENKKTVIVIDEYSYIANSLLSSLLQHFIDSKLSKSDSMLILCGSSTQIMEKEGKDANMPLYGRFEKIHCLQSLSYSEIKEFHPNMSDLDTLKLYLTIGGIPKYHVDVECKNFEEYMKTYYLSNEDMIHEIEYLISSEFKNPRRIIEVLSAIGCGYVSLKDIAERIKLDQTLTLKCIRELEEIGIVSKIEPMFDAPKRSNYQIVESLFAFHFCVVQNKYAYFNTKQVDEAYTSLEKHINTYLGRRFELYCMELIKDNYFTVEIGTWWMDRDNEHYEIDIVSKVITNDIKFDIFCECKFRKTQMGLKEINQFMKNTNRFEKNSNPKYFLFSISGFDSNLEDFAEKNKIYLIGPEMIYGHQELPKLV